MSHRGLIPAEARLRRAGLPRTPEPRLLYECTGTQTCKLMATTLATCRLPTHRLCEAGLQRLELLVAHALLDLQRMGQARGDTCQQVATAALCSCNVQACLSYKLLDASAVEFSLSTAAS